MHTAVAATEARERRRHRHRPAKERHRLGRCSFPEVPIVATAAASELGRVLEAADRERMTRRS
ncbi:hypothetical protein J4732_15155 [Serratia marcescens]|uniref:Uncharacterized protein n=1 Tax=Serratia marcescens TaxID=615 RepID=A0A939NRP6_SERMA|nr:hypothetical protein [Serratia marcescens]